MNHGNYFSDVARRLRYITVSVKKTELCPTDHKNYTHQLQRQTVTLSEGGMFCVRANNDDNDDKVSATCESKTDSGFH